MLMPMQPSPRADTSRLLLPNLGVCILFSCCYTSAAVPAMPISRSLEMSFIGALPKNRPYSRLNWDALR